MQGVPQTQTGLPSRTLPLVACPRDTPKHVCVCLRAMDRFISQISPLEVPTVNIFTCQTLIGDSGWGFPGATQQERSLYNSATIFPSGTF